MIFDYAIISTFILTAILFVILNYLRSSLKNIVKKLDVRELNTFNLNILVFYFFLAFILLGKLVVILAFPLELKLFSMQIPIFSQAMFFLITQGVSIAVYIFAIAIIVVHWNLKPDFRYLFLSKVLKFILFFALIEFVISIISYVSLNYNLLFFQELLSEMRFWTLNDEIVRICSIFIVLLLVASFVILWILQRKQKSLTHLLFILVAFITLFIEIFVSLYNFQFLHGKDIMALCLSDIFSFPGGIFSWIWFFIILLTPGVIFYSYFLIKLDTYFLNIYYARNYSLQINKIAFICLLGIGINSIFPGFLIYVFS